MKKSVRRTNNRRVSYYVDGNTVRKTDVARRAKSKPSVKPARKEGILDAPVDNKGMIAPTNVGVVLFAIIAIMIVCGSCIRYVGLRNEYTELQKKVARDRIVYNDMKLANEEEYDRIMGSVNLEEIKKTAMDDLGMDYPNADQVRLIPGAGSDYVRQFKAIPEKQAGDELEKTGGAK
ncbi:MAG: hypothetical protein K6F99_09430 [Lachnospiraceae bacterium]|nr:hypothetical protein [Lachnospiraceae bacterium]